MNIKNIVAGVILILIGLSLISFYEFSYKPESEAGKLYREALLLKERADNEEVFNREEIFQTSAMPAGQSADYSRLEKRSAVNSAIEKFNTVIAHYPDSDYAKKSLMMIADSYEKIGLYKLAYLKYSYLMKDKSVSKDPKSRSEVISRMAKLKIKKNYSEEGIAQLYSLLNQSIDTEFRSRIYSEIGYTYLKLGEVTKANKAFEIALRENSENVEAILGRARSLKRLGKSTEAFEQYDYFLAHHGAFSQYTPDVKNAYLSQAYSTARSLYKQGSYWAAIKYFALVINKFPSSKYTENSNFWIGESYYHLGKYGSARKYYGRVLSNGVYTYDQDARIKRGYAYFMEKKYDLAAKEFQLYIDNYPSGKFLNIAKKWKESSAKELTIKLEKQAKPEEENLDLDKNIKYEVEKTYQKKGKDQSISHVSSSSIELDDVTEL